MDLRSLLEWAWTRSRSSWALFLDFKLHGEVEAGGPNVF